MRIGCLQFAPEVGDVDNNLSRADDILNQADPQDLDLLVLPELAFTGYNFASLSHISPYLEQSDTGITSLWARTTALKHDCTVIAGYPEKVDLADRWPANPEYYNSALVVNADGEPVANYRKTHLYYTDETWALEGPTGFFAGGLPGLPRTAMGICMDINPYRFQTPWDSFEFANHVLDSGARLVVVSMAWLTQDEQAEFTSVPHEPDMNTLTYWVSRLEPIIRFDSPQEIIVVFANRTGTEGSATYAGTSAVVGIKSGEVLIYGILGRGERDLLVVDTDSTPLAKLVYRPEVDGIPAGEPTEQEPVEEDDEGPFRQAMGQGSDLSSGASTGFESDDRNDSGPDGKQIHPSLSTSDIYRREAVEQFFHSPGPLSPTASESHFSVSSLSSSRLYWLPLDKARSPVANPRRLTPSEAARSAGYASVARRQENRLSIRSDVSVWNNQPGRPRDMAHPLALSPEPTLHTSADLSSHDRYHEQRYAKNNEPRHHNSSAASHRPRPQSRSQIPKSAISATPDALGLHVPPSPHDFALDNVDDAALSETARWVQATAATIGLSSARQEMRSQPLKQTRNDNSEQRRTASARLQKAIPEHDVDYQTTRGADTSRKQNRHAESTEPPILQPASRSRVREGVDATPPEDIKRPSTDMERRSARDLRRDYMHSSQPRNGNNANVRASSRGRQRFTASPLEQDSGTRPARHRSAQNMRGSSREPVDLSQFRLIEEYPSATCPVHGSRSHSRQRQRTSRHDTPGGSRHRSEARESTRRRGASQDVSNPPTRPKDSPRSSARKMNRSCTISADVSADTPSKTKESARQPPRSSTINISHGPKTPVAMVFVQDTNKVHDNARAFSSLKCVEKGMAQTLSRPRSAVW